MHVRTWVEDQLLLAAAIGDGEQFAFYLYKDGEVVYKTLYSPNQAHSFRIDTAGTYRIKAFSLTPEGDKSRAWSDKINIPNNTERHHKPNPPHLTRRQLTSGSAFEQKPNQLHKNTLLSSDSGCSIFNLAPDKNQNLGLLLDLTASGYNVLSWILDIRQGPPVTASGWFNSGKIIGSTDRVIHEGWQYPKKPIIKFDQEIDWSTPGKSDRTWGFELHTWRFMDPVLDDYLKTGDENLLRWMLGVAESWWSYATSCSDEDSMAWYDMAISMRMPRLARLIVAAAKSPILYKTIGLLPPAIGHMAASKSPSSFQGHNNHGFYSAAAAIDFAEVLSPLDGSGELAALGEERMRIMADRQFATDGGHLEHSPDYHRTLLDSYGWAVRDSLIVDADIIDRVNRAVTVLGWMVQPDGHIVQFGDSPRTKVEETRINITDPRTEFLLTNGHRGTPNSQELFVLPESGYAFVRSPQPVKSEHNLKSSYLAFQCGFHSRAHKHADDLTFTWFDQGHELVVDAGKFGYGELLPSDSPDRFKGFFYSSLERQYIESTRAHNTVEVNGQDIERRSRQPYGSAVGHCTAIDGKFVLRGEVDHGSYVHRRVLRLDPEASLEVLDTIIPAGSRMQAISWFNLEGGLCLSSCEKSIRVALPNNNKTMTIVSEGKLIRPVRGESNPLGGWRSVKDGELEPAWNFGFEFHAAGETQISTVFTLTEN